jgi:two-component system response regulator PilR (NtrC family)
VLVVDDEPDIRELLELTLIKMGLDVVTAGNVGDAKARAGSEPFNLVLTDMRMPDGEGIEVVEFIAEQDWISPAPSSPPMAAPKTPSRR